MAAERCPRCDREECRREAATEAYRNSPPWTSTIELAGTRLRRQAMELAADDCAAHAVDWRARCLRAEADAARLAAWIEDYGSSTANCPFICSGSNACAGCRERDAALAAHRERGQ